MIEEKEMKLIEECVEILGGLEALLTMKEEADAKLKLARVVDSRRFLGGTLTVSWVYKGGA